MLNTHTRNRNEARTVGRTNGAPRRCAKRPVRPSTVIGVVVALAASAVTIPVSAATKSKPKSTGKSASASTKPVKPRTAPYLPNGRPPQPAVPFLWETQSPDPSLPNVGSFEAATTAIVPNNKLFKLVIIGSDARPNEDIQKTRGDSIHLFLWNPAFNKGVLIGIPRDSYVNVPGLGLSKINAALTSGGPSRVVAAVNDLSKLGFDNYVLTGFSGFTNMINDIGGVNVLVDPAMSDTFSGATFAKGWFAMNGDAALAFNRARKTLPNGDFTRSANQGRFLLYTMAKLREDVSDVGGLIKWINSFRKNVATNLKPSELLILAQIARHIDPSNIQNVVLSGKSSKIGKGKAAQDVVLLDPGYAGLFVDVGRDAVNDGK